jgi:hypothetical protein
VFAFVARAATATAIGFVAFFIVAYAFRPFAPLSHIFHLGVVELVVAGAVGLAALGVALVRMLRASSPAQEIERFPEASGEIDDTSP